MTAAGPWLLPLAALCTGLSAGHYLAAHRADRRGPGLPTNHVRWARFFFYAQAALVQIAAALLMSAILTHRFELDYVFSHSSTDLPFIYLVSTFWSGQEGTFLLWALYGGFFGGALIARSREWESAVMLVWSTLQLLVLGLLLARSPFLPLVTKGWTPGDLELLRTTFHSVPPEGQGLNPLLQNPWMAIHPPILFCGFCSLALPFTFALAGLLRGDLDGWTWRAQGWTLLSWAILGTGLILGGYWAYETLGWGGYWAWDPVENSSLVPWLFAGALFHCLLLQRAAGGAARRLSLALAGLAFTSVTYGSYLNRSGVLADFSVHSFVALSPAFNRALLVFALTPPLAFLALLWANRRRLDRRPLVTGTLSRKYLLHWVVLLLGGSATVVLIGNSWPLVSGLLAKVPFLHRVCPNPTSLQPAFYNQVHTPLAMVLAVLLTIVMQSGWDTLRQERLLHALRWPAAVAGVVAGLTIAGLTGFLRHRAGHPDWLHPTAGRLALAWGLVIVLCTLSAAINAQAFLGDWRRGERRTLGTHVAHTGFMVLVIGIVVSSVYETKTIVSLPLGAPLEFAGYRLRYDGLTPIGDRARLEVTVADARATRRVAPILRPGRDGLIRNPAIFKRWTHDLYLEPGELKAPEQPLEVKLDRTTPVTLGDLTLAFDGFELTDHQMDPNDFRVGIKLRATRGGETTVVKTALRVRGGAFEPEPGQLPGGGSVAVMDMPPKPGGGGDRYLVLEVQGAGGAGAPETAVLQVTVKPLMSVVWLGCWMTILGGLWAAVRRAVEATRRRAAEHPILHLLENRHGE